MPLLQLHQQNVEGFPAFAYSLQFHFVYFALGSDYERYMDINQRVNLGILEAFARIGVGFAFPTTAVQISASEAENTNHRA